MLKKNRLIIESLQDDVAKHDRDVVAVLAAMPKPLIESEPEVHYFAPVTVTVDASSERAEVNGSVTIQVEVTGEYDKPQGEVWLYDNGMSSRASRRLSEGTASFEIIFPFRGRHTFAARYVGDPVYEANPNSNSVTVTVM